MKSRQNTRRVLAAAVQKLPEARQVIEKIMAYGRQNELPRQWFVQRIAQQVVLPVSQRLYRNDGAIVQYTADDLRKVAARLLRVAALPHSEPLSQPLDWKVAASVEERERFAAAAKAHRQAVDERKRRLASEMGGRIRDQLREVRDRRAGEREAAGAQARQAAAQAEANRRAAEATERIEGEFRAAEVAARARRASVARPAPSSKAASGRSPSGQARRR